MKKNIPIPDLSEEQAIKFFNKINFMGSQPDQNNPHYQGLGRCWEWAAGLFADGYGAFYIHGTKNVRAHRVMYFMHFPDTPRDAHILHRCDNPACVNISHLSSGDHAANMIDLNLKGRGNQGEKHGMTKLTDEIVLEIRNAYSEGATNTDLSEKFSTPYKTIARITSGATWRHLLCPQSLTP